MLRRAFFKAVFSAPFVGKALAAKYDRVELSRGAATSLTPRPWPITWANDPDIAAPEFGDKLTISSGDK